MLIAKVLVIAGGGGGGNNAGAGGGAGGYIYKDNLPLESKTYTVRVKADWDDDIEEQSESNNGYSESIYLNKN